MNETEMRHFAEELAHKYPIVDGHVDLPYRLVAKNFRLTKEFIGLPVESKEGDFDYVRAKIGGLTVPFMSIFIPSNYQMDGGAREYADSLIRMVKGIAAAHPDKFVIATSTSQVKMNFEKGLISLPLGMENGAPIEHIDDVEYYFRQGIRYVTLTHSKDNQICDSSYDTTRTHKGLSEFGKKVVLEMNRLGMMVDISHVSDEAFYQVMQTSKAPCIASHSSCRSFTPDWQRNMDDQMIRTLAKNGGVIMINFGTSFLDSEIRKNRGELMEILRDQLMEKGLKEDDEAAQPLVEQFKRTHQSQLYADVERVADHIDHVRNLVGIEHIGFGSDFDGVGDSLPTGLKDVSMYPNLIYALLRRGYSEKDIAKICYKNAFRVWDMAKK